VLAGVFGSDATARAGLKALKALGVPAYLEQGDKSQGAPRIMLHAGPFNDRASAEAAVKKIRRAGLAAVPSKK
jgi:DedD protein